MSQQQAKQITISKASLIAGLVLALVAGGAIVYLTLPETQQSQTVTQLAPEAKPEPAPTPAKKPVEKKAKQTLAKPTKPAKPAKPTKPTKQKNEFVIEGLLSTGGEPWTANMIMIKILWLKNKNYEQFMLGQETSVVQATPNGFAYRIILRPQSSKYLNWNGGVQGNVGRVIAFLDHKRDGRLTLNKDKIIAVSKELVRYRTGRYDKNILNEIQQQNIQQAGKGYVIVRNMQVGDSKADWKVVASDSPARLDLSAAETSLPSMYNTFMKLQ